MSAYKLIRKLRKQKGWSQEYLAEVADVSKATISAYERGSRVGTVDMLRRIAKALGAHPGDLIDKEEELQLTTDELFDALRERARRELDDFSKEQIERLLDLAKITYDRGHREDE